jgi:hypothetical protein
MKATDKETVAASVANKWIAHSKQILANGQNPGKLSDYGAMYYEDRIESLFAAGLIKSGTASYTEIDEIANRAVAIATQILKAGLEPELMAHFSGRKNDAVASFCGRREYLVKVPEIGTFATSSGGWDVRYARKGSRFAKRETAEKWVAIVRKIYPNAFIEVI